MLFYSFFKTLHGKVVVVELKNDLSIRGKNNAMDLIECLLTLVRE